MSDTVTPPPASAAPKSRLNRWLAIGLIASVALNIGFASFGAVRFFKYRELAERRGWQIEDQVARKLPDNAAKAFRHAFEDGRKGGAISHNQMRRDLGAALGAEPYDHNRLAAVLAEHRQRLDQLQAGMQAGLLAAADAMTPDQRREFAARMLRRGPPGPPGGPMDGPMGGPPHMRGDAPPPPPPRN
ncbi:MAG: periplasmic heavy metal sensor [Ferrovibrio sp.]|uniref:periplasmic heavy metal sensor n=1 Tax=Ferrovibrio sp. TaxID=1917215 RepID=UPI002615F8CD|nr:periplasmic heavy metal sensor [Ferrovibrio sp.]MCW0232683.1 periplasmic heavy metal sensor [Ferrovibrio sp.]